jgi:hypothetical protein
MKSIFRRTALFFLTLAATILVLHSAIPHFHHHSEGHHHERTNNHAEENKNFADFLSIINHQSEGITFLHSSQIFKLKIKELTVSFFLVQENFSIKAFLPPPLLSFFPEKFLEAKIFDPCKDSLRGPPSIG